MMARLGVLFFLFSLCWLAQAQSAQTIAGQYILIELPGIERTLSLAEVKVYSGQKDISQHGKSVQVSTFGEANAARAIDGNTSGDYFGHSVTSTATQPNPWWEINLGSEEPITRITIHNRTDCCRDRINPARVQILDKMKRVLWEGAIRTAEAQYEFNPTQSSKSGRSISPNLLRNSTFQQHANHSIPDYWDLNHVAALTFKNLHEQYGIDDNTESPVPGAKALRIRNSEDKFPHLTLAPRRLFYTLPDGEYTFSAYLKADRGGVKYKMTRAGEEGEAVIHELSTTWERYSDTFRITNKNSDSLQLIMFFPSPGTYFVSAPQLERGNKPSPFQPLVDDESAEILSFSPKQQLKNFLDSINGKVSVYKQALLTATFDYNYYTSQQAAPMVLTYHGDSDVKALIACASGENKIVTLPVQNEFVIRPSSSIVIDVPIGDMPVGNYICRVEVAEGNTKQTVATAKLIKLRTNPVEIRINEVRRFISINDKPFHMIGMGVGSWNTPSDWYFKDLATHGINTVFYTHPPNAQGDYDVRDVEAFLSGAARYGLKAIIGIPLAGAKVPNWRQRLAGFCRLIISLKENPTVIGWFPVDEPASHTWQDDELIEIYKAIKKTDPYRLVLINWAYDGVPPQVGQEPRGTLGSSDIYSTDYYPFAGQRRNMDGFTINAVRTLETARIHRKVAHSWIQLYGGGDAWREPTGDEINYMVYFNIVYGGSLSYWDTKSNSGATWKRLSVIHQEVRVLAEELFLNPESREILSPIEKDDFVYSVWKKGKRIFLLVAHNGNGAGTFTLETATYTGRRLLHVNTLFRKTDVPVVNNQIQDVFRPFECKVYVLDGE